jgi:hypothetical protein
VLCRSCPTTDLARSTGSASTRSAVSAASERDIWHASRRSSCRRRAEAGGALSERLFKPAPHAPLIDAHESPLPQRRPADPAREVTTSRCAPPARHASSIVSNAITTMLSGRQPVSDAIAIRVRATRRRGSRQRQSPPRESRTNTRSLEQATRRCRLRGSGRLPFPLNARSRSCESTGALRTENTNVPVSPAKWISECGPGELHGSRQATMMPAGAGAPRQGFAHFGADLVRRVHHWEPRTCGFPAPGMKIDAVNPPHG